MAFLGNHFIQNEKTKRYLRATNDIETGSKLETVAAPQELGQAYKFHLRTVTGEQVKFTSSYKSLVAGVGNQGNPKNSALVWKNGEHMFRVTQIAAGDTQYNIRLTSQDNLYWFDSVAPDHPDATVILKEGDDTNRTIWRLIPAA
ncbi:hypothetical protein D9757_013206 [Collybiopsis confluens]|uniref:Uncharacterized protein n=1 Tax=Collybiopsis confluens TaxID=2823264 RepID=A0A8H5G1K7_9AGAR|nr:hypothetical protein D9757_013206 [Collybiopsis confluens]